MVLCQIIFALKLQTKNINVTNSPNKKSFSISIFFSFTLSLCTFFGNKLLQKETQQKIKPQPLRKYRIFLASIHKPNKPEALTLNFSFHCRLCKASPEWRSRCLHLGEVESSPKPLAPERTEPPSSSTLSCSTTRFGIASSPSTRSVAELEFYE